MERCFPLWLIPVILVDLGGVGVGNLSSRQAQGNDSTGSQRENHPRSDLGSYRVNLTLDTGDVGTVQGKPEDADHIVSQTPDAGTKAKPEIQ